MSTATDNRDRFRAIAFQYRHLPGEYGLRPHTVTLISTDYAVTTGEGASTGWTHDVTEANGQPPKVRWLKQDELALGNLPAGSVTIGPITPDANGNTIAVLTGKDLERGGTFYVRITGPQHPDGALYSLKATGADRALHYSMTCVPVADSETD